MRSKTEPLYELRWRSDAPKWNVESPLTKPQSDARRMQLLKEFECSRMLHDGSCSFPFADCDGGVEIHVTKL